MRRRSLPSLTLAAAVCGALSLVSAPATADEASGPQAAAGYSEERKDGGDAVVKFKDDVMGADGQKPLGDIIKPTPIATRAGLMRPRFNFVGELLKSVENL